MPQVKTIDIYLLARDQELANRLHSCYQSIIWGSDYSISHEFTFTSRDDWTRTLPSDSEGLVFIEMESEGVEAESRLIREMRIFNPKLQIALLVEPEIDYFQVARECGIGNILKKKQFDVSIIRALSIRLMTGNIFGFDPYFPSGYSIGPLHRTYCGEVVLEEIIRKSYNRYRRYFKEEESSAFRIFIHELLLNTFAYAIQEISPKDRDEKLLIPPPKLFIEERKSIKISMAADEEKVGFAVSDSTGNLSMLRVLEKLRRQSCIANEMLPPGIWDESGRGISLVHRYTRFIVNILKGVRTETIFLHYHEQEKNRYESVIITEVTPFHLEG